jgi:hypothetical protein
LEAELSLWVDVSSQAAAESFQMPHGKQKFQTLAKEESGQLDSFNTQSREQPQQLYVT